MADNTERKNKSDSKTKQLTFSTENGWNELSDAEDQRLQNLSSDYRQFLSKVKTERETCVESIRLAKNAGYVDIKDRLNGKVKLKPGDKVFFNMAGKTLLLFHIGEKPIEEGLRIVGGHTDSPRLDLKPRPLYEDSDLCLLDTHYYGGIKKFQWVTMPLALHGTVAKKNGEIAT